MSCLESSRISTTGFECCICKGGTPGLYDKVMMDEQLKSQLQHRIVVEGDAEMHELSEICATGHMCCTQCHKGLLRMHRQKCPSCRRALLPIDSRKIHMYSHEKAVDMKLDSDSAQLRADTRNVNFKLPEFRVNIDLAKAITDHDESTVFQLLLKGANANACLESGLPLVVYAAHISNWNIVTMLLHAGAHSSACDNESKESLICIAVRAGNTKMVECLLKNYMIPANSLSPEGEHILIEAANTGGWKIVFLLIDNGASVNTRSLQSESLVDIAFRTSNYDATKKLTTRNIDLSSPVVNNCVANAASHGLWPYVFFMLDAGVCPMLCNTKNESLLCIAVRGNHLCSVEKLLQTYKVSPDSFSPTGEPLIIETATTGHWEVVFTLLNNGGNKHCLSLQGVSLADIAIRARDCTVLLDLIKLKVGVNLLSPSVKDCLTDAAKKKNWTHVFRLLDVGVYPNGFNSNHESLLYIAISNNERLVVNTLLEKYLVSADSLSPTHESVILTAMRMSLWSIVKALLQHGAPILSCMHDNENILDVVFQHYDIKNANKFEIKGLVYYLIQQGVRADLLSRKSECHLAVVAQQGDWTFVQAMLNAGAMGNGFTLDKKSLIALAFVGYQNQIITLLIERGVNTDSLLQDGETLIAKAAFVDSWDIVTSLLDAGVSADSKTLLDESLLSIAVQRNQISMVGVLIRHHANVNTFTKTKKSLIATAVASKFADIYFLLMEAGAILDEMSIIGILTNIVFWKKHLNIDNIMQALPQSSSINELCYDNNELLVASLAFANNWEAVSYMLKYGASVHSETKGGESAISIAVQRNNNNIHMLLSYGALAHSFTAKKEPLVLLAAAQKWWHTVQTLLSAGAPINCTDAAGMTLLWHAVAQKNFEMVQYLHDEGASFEINTPQGHRIFALADSTECEAICTCLIHWYSPAVVW